jgi:hypothetical protein
MGAKFALQDDNTFTVQDGRRTLKFKLHENPRCIELLSVTDASAGSATPVKIDWDSSDVLDHLSRSNCAFVYLRDVANIEDLASSLENFKDISKQIEAGGGPKPHILLRSDALTSLGPRAKLDKAMRGALERGHGLDTRIVSYAKMPKK